MFSQLITKVQRAVAALPAAVSFQMNHRQSRPLDEPCNTSKKKRCRKRPKSRSSAPEMLEFLKSYSNKREKMEEEKLKVLKEIKDEKSSFFNRFFDYLEKKKP